MNSKNNFDKVFDQEYNSNYLELETYAIKALSKNSNSPLFVKNEEIYNEIKETLELITHVKISATQWDPDPYTRYLLETHFDSLIGRYINDPIENYIKIHMKSVKEQFKDSRLSIPGNIKLDERETVQLIARYKATKEFVKHLGTINKDDSLELCLKKISKEGYTVTITSIISGTEAYPSEKEDKDQIRKLKQEYTTTRQVLAIQYLFKYAQISPAQYDKTKMAEFIRFLTGRELGATKISDTTIYKKVNNPFKDKDSEKIEDLKYIRKFFLELNLGEIVDLINKEIEGKN